MKALRTKISTFIQKYKINRIFDYFLFPLFIVIIFDLFYKANGFIVSSFTNISFVDIFLSLFYHFDFFIISYLFVWGINLFLINIFNNTKISKILMMLFFGILMLANDFKIVAMQLPIKFSDINYLGVAGGKMTVSVLDSIKGAWIYKTIIKLMGVALLSLIFFYVSHCHKEKTNAVKIRIGSLLIGLLFINAPFLFSKPLRNSLITDSIHAKSSSLIDIYYDYGAMSGMFYDYYMDIVISPKGYDKQHIETIVNKSNKKTNENIDNPNVVIILSESFSDISKISEIKFDKQVLENYYKLDILENAETFNMYSPTNGGASVNSEFEILTGGRIRFFNTGYIPYYQLYTKSKTFEIPNLIKEFNNNDYATKYITPWRGDSYRSSYVYHNIGIDDTLYGSDLQNPRLKGGYVSDEYLTDVIINELKTDTNNKFIFMATSQNHVPYAQNKYNQYDINVVSTSLSAENTALLRTYAQGLYDADKQLQRLYEEIQKISKPTIVLFYGDHLPYIVNSSGENLYNQMSYFNTDNNLENEKRLYITPGAIISNRNINNFPFNEVNAHYLGAYLLSMTSLKTSNYFNYINDMMYKLPIIGTSFYQKENEIIPGNAESLIEEYNCVQYRYFYDYE